MNGTGASKINWLMGILQGLVITVMSALLLSGASRGERITKLESITMDKVEIVTRIDDLDDTIDDRMDSIEFNQRLMLMMLKEIRDKE